MTTITVTAQHIAQGKRADCVSCPVALAIHDALPDVGVVKVGNECLTIIFRIGNIPHLVELDLPEAALIFIWSYDAADYVEPFSFELNYPAEVAA